MKSYLNDRQQWVRVNNSFSSWGKIITVAQYLDRFYLKFLSIPGRTLKCFTYWFWWSYVMVMWKLHDSKCLERIKQIKLLFSKIWYRRTAKDKTILGVTIDNKLNCKSHIKKLCKKASQIEENCANTELILVRYFLYSDMDQK